MAIDYYSNWLVNKFGGTNGADAIKIAVKKLIADSHQVQLPIKLSKIASVIGINPTPIYANQEPWGKLITVNNELRISLKMKSGKQPSVNWIGYPRLRFSYAHELIHCLHYDFTTNPPERVAPKSISKREEEMCNYGAGLLLLPKSLVETYVQSLISSNIIEIASKLAKTAQTSLHAAFLHVVNNDYMEQKQNKIYILSANHEGFHNRNLRKPRCMVSVFYSNDKLRKTFLPTYQGIDAINNSWSLVRYYEKGVSSAQVQVKNEIIKYDKKRYVLNGVHTKIAGTGYIWSDLNAELLNEGNY